MLGLIGEYVGRMFLTMNQRPQSIVREVISGGGTLDLLAKAGEGRGDLP